MDAEGVILDNLNNVAQGICCSAGGHILRKISE